jgi:hypothetical protein
MLGCICSESSKTNINQRIQVVHNFTSHILFSLVKVQQICESASFHVVSAGAVIVVRNISETIGIVEV